MECRVESLSLILRILKEKIGCQHRRVRLKKFLIHGVRVDKSSQFLGNDGVESIKLSFYHNTA